MYLMTAVHESFTNTQNSYWFLYMPWEIWIPFYTDSTLQAWRFLRKQQHPSAFVPCYLPFLASEMEDLCIICSNFTEIASDCTSSHYPQRHISTLFQENFWCWQSFSFINSKHAIPFCLLYSTTIKINIKRIIFSS